MGWHLVAVMYFNEASLVCALPTVLSFVQYVPSSSTERRMAFAGLRIRRTGLLGILRLELLAR